MRSQLSGLQRKHRPPDGLGGTIELPRDGDGPIRWFTASPTYVLHFSNAWEEEEGNVVVVEEKAAS